MASTQFNVRVDEEEKALGDQAFASIGYTPSQAVQALWRFAAKNRRDRKALRRFASLLEERDGSEASEREARLHAHETAPEIFREMLAEMGIDGQAAPLDLSDEDLLFRAQRDKTARQEALV